MMGGVVKRRVGLTGEVWRGLDLTQLGGGVGAGRFCWGVLPALVVKALKISCTGEAASSPLLSSGRADTRRGDVAAGD